MRTKAHTAISIAAGGAVWVLLESMAAGVCCLLTGLLLDVDHLVDYLLHHPRRNTFHDLVDVCENCRLQRVVLPLHSWELLLLLLPALVLAPGQTRLLFGAAIGLLIHLLADQLANPVTNRAYFLTHRWRQGFRRTAFFDDRALERRR